MTSSENSCFPYCSRIFAKSKGAACAAGNFSATSYYLNNLPLSFFTFSRYDKGAKQRCGAKLQLFLLFHFFLSSYFFHTEAAGGSCGFCISARPNFGGAHWRCTVGAAACPARLVAMPERQIRCKSPPGQRKAFPWRGRCHAFWRDG